MGCIPWYIDNIGAEPCSRCGLILKCLDKIRAGWLWGRKPGKTSEDVYEKMGIYLYASRSTIKGYIFYKNLEQTLLYAMIPYSDNLPWFKDW